MRLSRLGRDVPVACCEDQGLGGGVCTRQCFARGGAYITALLFHSSRRAEQPALTFGVSLEHRRSLSPPVPALVYSGGCGPRTTEACNHSRKTFLPWKTHRPRDACTREKVWRILEQQAMSPACRWGPGVTGREWGEKHPLPKGKWPRRISSGLQAPRGFLPLGREELASVSWCHHFGRHFVGTHWCPQCPIH